jgi:catechol 2,3-dioxygenase-like lactoylglutathione lyase family enzyme
MLLLGLDHLQIAMPPGREADARRFYAGLLGMAEVPKPLPLVSRGGCWFEAHGVSLHLGVAQDFSPALKAHPALLVDDLAACRAQLAAAGVPITPDDVLPDVRRFYAHDPFGNRIEFIQNGDGFSQR